MEQLKEKLKHLSGGRILDVCTGFGGFVKQLKDSFGSYDKIIGIDQSEEYIEKAEKEIKDDNIRFEAMNAEDLQFADSSFDTVSISNSLHHLKNPDKVLNEMTRVLKKGGLFIICEIIFDKELETENSHHHIHHWWAEVDRLNNITHNKTISRKNVFELASKLNLKELDSFEHIGDAWTANDEDMEKIGWLVTKCDEYINKVKDNPTNDELVQRGEKLKEILSTTGCTLDPLMYILGRK
ncbi:MAG: class I SAM-dependent methyltransferase [candidate division Zixibacteria bacterium]|nr:class I SAM-dependent methyltransferase [candidate division Zixibacteria bacterium]